MQRIKEIRFENEYGFFAEMSPAELCQYIVTCHHSYVRDTIPTIIGYLQKVFDIHKDRYQYMEQVLDSFKQIAIELQHHMLKEEKILFPMMHRLGQILPEMLRQLILAMESDHKDAEELMVSIKTLTTNLTLPEEACNTYRSMLQSLKEFDADLSKHIYLENKILFPKALELAGR